MGFNIFAQFVMYDKYSQLNFSLGSSPHHSPFALQGLCDRSSRKTNSWTKSLVNTCVLPDVTKANVNLRDLNLICKIADTK